MAANTLRRIAETAHARCASWRTRGLGGSAMGMVGGFVGIGDVDGEDETETQDAEAQVCRSEVGPHIETRIDQELILMARYYYSQHEHFH